MKLDVALTLRLIDRLTRPLRDPTRATQGMNRAAEAGVAALRKFGGVTGDLQHFEKLTRGANAAGNAAAGVGPDAARSAERIGRLRADIEHFRVLKREVGSTAEEITLAQQRATRLAQLLASARNQTNPNEARIRRLAGAFERAKDAAGRLKRAQDDQRESLNRSRQSLRDAGVDTRNLNRDTRTLTETTDAHAEALERQQRRAGRIERARMGVGQADGMLQRNAARRDALRGQAFEAGALGYGAMRFMAGAGQSQSTVTDIGITAGISVPERRALAANVEGISRDTYQPRREVFGAMSQLAAAGLDYDVTQRALPAISRTATAANAAVPDIGVAAIATLQSLDIPVERLAKSFDMMTMGGDIGRFELRDMAAKFESFTSLGVSHGITGEEGLATHIAAAQISRRAAGSSDAAATNYENFLSKISAPDTIKSFEDRDVDLLARLREGDAEGKNRLETIVELTMEVADGDTAIMQELFRDQQAFKFVNRMVQEYDLYRDWKTEVMAAEGTTDRFFADRTTNDPTLQWRRFGEELTIVRDKIARPLLPILSDLIVEIGPMIQKVGEWVANNQQLVGSIAKVLGGLLVLKIGLVAVGFAATALITPLLLLWKGFGLARLGLALLGKGGAATGLLARLGPLAYGLAIPLARLAGSAAGLGYVLSRGLVADLSRFGRAFAGLMGLRSLRLASLVLPVRWTLRLLPPIPWGRLKAFRLASLVKPLAWVARLLPAIAWGALARRSGTFGMDASGWGRLIKPLQWFGRGALRLIPVIGWAVMAAEIGMFAWKLLGLKPLDWSAFIDRIGWSNWFGFEWKDLLPDWSWSDIVPSFSSWWSGQDTDVTAKVRYDGAFDALGSAVEVRRAGEETGTVLKSPARNLKPVTAPVNLGGSAGLDGFLARGGKPALDGERREGGPVWPGGVFKVGEEGEELFVPHQAGTILPAFLTAMLFGRDGGNAAGGAGGKGGAGAGGVGFRAIIERLTGGAIALDGARREGGPVWPGGIFKVGEEGEELFVPHQAGTVLPAFLTAMLSGDNARTGARSAGRSGASPMPGMLAAMMLGGTPLAATVAPDIDRIDAFSSLRIDTRPALGGTASRGGTVGSGTVIEAGAIVINPAPDQDPHEIAREVIRQIEGRERQKQKTRRHSDGDLHDGRHLFE